VASSKFVHENVDAVGMVVLSVAALCSGCGGSRATPRTRPPTPEPTAGSEPTAPGRVITVSPRSSVPTWILSVDGPAYAYWAGSPRLATSTSIAGLRGLLFDGRVPGHPACRLEPPVAVVQPCWPDARPSGGGTAWLGSRTVLVAVPLWQLCFTPVGLVTSQHGHDIEFAVSQKYVCRPGFASAAMVPLALVGIRPEGPLTDLIVTVSYINIS
jgi:hypothetical protein